jgi:hypothetical protein
MNSETFTRIGVEMEKLGELQQAIGFVGLEINQQKKRDEKLLARLRNIIMTEATHSSDEKMLSLCEYLRETLDFMLIRHDSVSQGRTIENVQEEWEGRYGTDRVDYSRGEWEHKE